LATSPDSIAPAERSTFLIVSSILHRLCRLERRHGAGDQLAVEHVVDRMVLRSVQ
jgi:hypothetical protein